MKNYFKQKAELKNLKQNLIDFINEANEDEKTEIKHQICLIDEQIDRINDDYYISKPNSSRKDNFDIPIFKLWM